MLFDAFLLESKWLSTSQIPSLDEYLSNGVITTTAPLALVHLFFMLGHDISTMGPANFTAGHIPRIISCPSKILRLWDDMGSAKVRTLQTFLGHGWKPGISCKSSTIQYITSPTYISCTSAARSERRAGRIV
jgi:hypothetical protein